MTDKPQQGKQRTAYVMIVKAGMRSARGSWSRRPARLVDAQRYTVRDADGVVLRDEEF